MSIIGFLLLTGCAVQKNNLEKNIQLRFLAEYIIPPDLDIQGVRIGGLSDLYYDKSEGYFYTLSDSHRQPRIYKLDIVIRNQQIDTVRFVKALAIKKDSGKAKNLNFDAEGLVYQPQRNLFILSSEGHINGGKDPFIIELDSLGQVIKQYRIPSYFKADFEEGPRNNGLFEGLTQSVNPSGIWVANELPLKMDGPKTKLYRTKSPVRFTYFNTKTGKAEQQFAYRLGRLRKIPLLPFAMNGISAILEYAPKQFLVLERAFSAGHGSHGIRARLYQVDARKATPTLSVKNLHKKLGKQVIPAKKTLVLDFNEIRNKLTDRIIDNLEGISFGPRLNNGHQSLLIISDNNFNSFAQQLNQVILMEIIIPQ